MLRNIVPRPIGGSLAAIASKSQAHRLLICAALARSPSRIRCAECSDDIDATVRCLNALGAHIDRDGDIYAVQPLRQARFAELDCGESGSTLRFLIPLVAALGCGARFRMHGRLSQRPLSPMQELLEERGIVFSRPEQDILCIEGKLPAGAYAIAGNVSSQFITGLLLALPLTGGACALHLTSVAESAPYIALTLSVLRSFGVPIGDLGDGWQLSPCFPFPGVPEARVEGDWSNAAFWLCAGAVSRRVCMTGLSADSVQGDRRILDVLQAFGAQVQWLDGERLYVSPAPLSAVSLNVRDIPDLVPPIALLAACAEGCTHIYGAERLRLKESDRLQSVCATLKALGGQAEITDDGLCITGGPLRGGCVDSHNDHRIAMLAAIAASVCSEAVLLHGAEAVNKSYPRFWEDYERMRYHHE